MFRKLQNLLGNHAETSERHVDERLQTHYFKASKTKVMNELKQILEEETNFKELAFSEERGEVTFEVKKPKNAFVVVSIVTVRHNHTAVDLNVSTESALPLNFGYNQRLVTSIYERLKQRLPFLGTAMAENL
ncbi:cytosolic protein [Fictibacillus phosphorivorans]|uniref:cytosolic protein n=1 Tax=Fictibacillus phosphorivorans TaxID=1221500 RepID=UPI00203CD02E|nr:cytosolic protein [Fictibacillus phosphorivorans]MCM3717901.1 cytosolic protein [Fictibacillus phosphorivorans]MCM3775350.1 cytosolic protein [Fictibacillus phosphorivorans]